MMSVFEIENHDFTKSKKNRNLDFVIRSQGDHML